MQISFQNSVDLLMFLRKLGREQWTPPRLVRSKAPRTQERVRILSCQTKNKEEEEKKNGMK